MCKDVQEMLKNVRNTLQSLSTVWKDFTKILTVTRWRVGRALNYW